MDYGIKDLEFFGKITASVTHEMKNVLAIIKESAGLMEDLMAFSGGIPDSLKEKCQNTLNVIKSQIKRGSEISDRLNRVAHAPDVRTASMELGAAVLLISGLAGRFASLKNIHIEAGSKGRPVTVTTYPVIFMRTLFAIIECCLANLPPHSRILIEAEPTDGRAAIHFTAKAEDADADNLFRALSADGRWPELRQLAASLSGSLEGSATGSGVRLYLPASVE